MSSHETLVCVNFYFDESIAHLCEFEEAFANHGHIHVAFAFTQVTQHPTESLLPMFLQALHFLPITVPKPDELDTNFTETLPERNPNRVARTEPQFRLEPIICLLHLEVKFRVEAGWFGRWLIRQWFSWCRELWFHTWNLKGILHSWWRKRIHLCQKLNTAAQGSWVHKNAV